MYQWGLTSWKKLLHLISEFFVSFSKKKNQGHFAEDDETIKNSFWSNFYWSITQERTRDTKLMNFLSPCVLTTECEHVIVTVLRISILVNRTYNIYADKFQALNFNFDPSVFPSLCTSLSQLCRLPLHINLGKLEIIWKCRFIRSLLSP